MSLSINSGVVFIITDKDMSKGEWLELEAVGSFYFEPHIKRLMSLFIMNNKERTYRLEL